MTTNPSRVPDISGYIELVDRVVAHKLLAPEFEASHLQMVKSEDRALGEPVPVHPMLTPLPRLAPFAACPPTAVAIAPIYG